MLVNLVGQITMGLKQLTRRGSGVLTKEIAAQGKAFPNKKKADRKIGTFVKNYRK